MGKRSNIRLPFFIFLYFKIDAMMKRSNYALITALYSNKDRGL